MRVNALSRYRRAVGMALSEHEQRALEEIEGMLTANDPSLASNLRRTHGRPSMRAAVALLVVVAGLGLVFLGLVLANTIGTAIAVVGFAATVAGGYLAARELRRIRAR